MVDSPDWSPHSSAGSLDSPAVDHVALYSAGLSAALLSGSVPVSTGNSFAWSESEDEEQEHELTSAKTGSRSDTNLSTALENDDDDDDEEKTAVAEQQFTTTPRKKDAPSGRFENKENQMSMEEQRAAAAAVASPPLKRGRGSLQNNKVTNIIINNNMSAEDKMQGNFLKIPGTSEAMDIDFNGNEGQQLLAEAKNQDDSDFELPPSVAVRKKRPLARPRKHWNSSDKPASSSSLVLGSSQLASSIVDSGNKQPGLGGPKPTEMETNISHAAKTMAPTNDRSDCSQANAHATDTGLDALVSKEAKRRSVDGNKDKGSQSIRAEIPTGRDDDNLDISIHDDDLNMSIQNDKQVDMTDGGFRADTGMAVDPVTNKGQLTVQLPTQVAGASPPPDQKGVGNDGQIDYRDSNGEDGGFFPTGEDDDDDDLSHDTAMDVAEVDPTTSEGQPGASEATSDPTMGVPTLEAVDDSNREDNAEATTLNGVEVNHSKADSNKILLSDDVSTGTETAQPTEEQAVSDEASADNSPQALVDSLLVKKPCEQETWTEEEWSEAFLPVTEQRTADFPLLSDAVIKNELRSLPETTTYSWNACDTDGFSLIHLAVSLRRVEGLQWLLSKKATCLIRDAEHQNPLHLACAAGWAAFEIVKILLKKEPGLLLAKDISGRTPLQHVPSSLHKKFMKEFEGKLNGCIGALSTTGGFAPRLAKDWHLGRWIRDTKKYERTCVPDSLGTLISSLALSMDSPPEMLKPFAKKGQEKRLKNELRKRFHMPNGADPDMQKVRNYCEELGLFLTVRDDLHRNFAQPLDQRVQGHFLLFTNIHIGDKDGTDKTDPNPDRHCFSYVANAQHRAMLDNQPGMKILDVHEDSNLENAEETVLSHFFTGERVGGKVVKRVELYKTVQIITPQEHAAYVEGRDNKSKEAQLAKQAKEEKEKEAAAQQAAAIAIGEGALDAVPRAICLMLRSYGEPIPDDLYSPQFRHDDVVLSLDRNYRNAIKELLGSTAADGEVEICTPMDKSPLSWVKEEKELCILLVTPSSKVGKQRQHLKTRALVLDAKRHELYDADTDEKSKKFDPNVVKSKQQAQDIFKSRFPLDLSSFDLGSIKGFQVKKASGSVAHPQKSKSGPVTTTCTLPAISKSVEVPGALWLALDKAGWQSMVPGTTDQMCQEQQSLMQSLMHDDHVPHIKKLNKAVKNYLEPRVKMECLGPLASDKLLDRVGSHLVLMEVTEGERKRTRAVAFFGTGHGDGYLYHPALDQHGHFVPCDSYSTKNAATRGANKAANKAAKKALVAFWQSVDKNSTSCTIESVIRIAPLKK